MQDHIRIFQRAHSLQREQIGIARTGADQQHAAYLASRVLRACKLGFEGIVSKHREHPYRSGPSKAWLKVKNPKAPGVTRFEDRGDAP